MPQYNTYGPADTLGGNEIILVEQGGVTLRSSPNALKNFIGYVLPTANVSTLGGVKAGSDITIDTAGLMSVIDNSHNHTWANITNTPTTLLGYGITDAFPPHGHPWSEITATPTTLLGYDITDAAPLSHVGGAIHIDWSVTGAEQLHADRYVGISDHTLLSNIGTNTHPQIDAHLGLVNAHLDWTLAVGTIHASNYTNTVYSHPNHTGEITSTGDGATVLGATAWSNRPSVLSSDIDDYFLVNRIGGLNKVTMTNLTNYFDSNLNFAATNHTHSTYDYDTLATPGIVVQSMTVTDGIVTAVSDGLMNHADLSGLIANEHLDWTLNVGTINPGNYTDTVYVLPVADTGVLGGIRDGTDLSIDVTGNVSVNNNSHSHIWANISDPPTTLSGYGITDAIENNIGAYDIVLREQPTAGVVTSQRIDQFTDNPTPVAGDLFFSSDFSGVIKKTSLVNLEAVLNHDSLTNYVSQQHIRWDLTGAEVIHADRYTSSGSEVNDLTASVTWANVPIANVPTGTTGITVAFGNHAHSTYDSNLGTTTSTVVEHITVVDGIVTNLVSKDMSHGSLAGLSAEEHIDWTSGLAAGFHSIGIDDNASSERMQVSDTALAVGGANGYSIHNNSSSYGLSISGGTSSVLGANLVLHAQSNIPDPFDVLFRASAVATLHHDYSASLWDFQANDIATTGDITGGGVSSGSNPGHTHTMSAITDSINLLKIVLRKSAMTEDVWTTPQVIRFDSELTKDTGYTHSTVTNPERVTVSTTGTYRISYKVGYIVSATARITPTTGIRVNGVLVTQTETKGYSRGAAYGDCTTAYSTVMDLTASDYIDLWGDFDQADVTGAAPCTSEIDECELIVERLSTEAAGNTDTWRAIHDTPVNAATTVSISSNWAFDHAALTNEHIDWKTGTEAGFHSLGIDDNATKEVINVGDTSTLFGDGSLGEQYHIGMLLPTGDGYINIGTTNTTTTGTSWRMYSPTHASVAYDARFYADNVIELSYDHSASKWDFEANLITTTGAIVGASFGGITSANLLDKSAAETISGNWTFDGSTYGLLIATHTLTTQSDIALSANAMIGGDTSLSFGVTGSTFNWYTGNTANTSGNSGGTIVATLTTAGFSVTGTLSASNLSGTNTGDEPDASLTVKGIVEVATQAEVDTGTDTLRSVSPATLARAVGRTVSKTANETLSNSSTLQNDDHLVLSLAASKTYTFKMILKYNAGSSGGIVGDFTIPSGATMHWQHSADQYGSALVVGSTTWQPNVSGNVQIHEFVGVVTTSTTAGNLQFQWAQWSANATGITMYTGCLMELIEV